MNSNDTKKDAAIERYDGDSRTLAAFKSGELSRQDEIDKLTAELTSLRSPWVRVSERLPESEGEYFVRIESDYLGEYHAVAGFDGNEFEASNIVAWMPIPPFDSSKDAAGLEGE